MNNKAIVTNASTIITSNIKEYQRYLLEKLPNPIDGLKNIHRRALWLMKDHDGLRDMAAVVGDMASLHPHGELGTWKAILRLMQPHIYINPLIESKGSTGDYVLPQVAVRYAKGRLSNFCRDIYFNDIDYKTFSMTNTELLNGYEPKYLIPKIPMALIIDNLNIGLGFSSNIKGMSNLKNICELVQKYIDNKFISGQIDLSKIAHLFLPDLPNNGYLRNREQLIEAYSQGVFEVPITIDGTLDIEENVIVAKTSGAYATTFSSAMEKIDEELKSKTFWLNDVLQDLNNYSSAKNEGAYHFTFKRSCNVFEYLDKFKKSVHFTENIHALFHYHWESEMLKLTPINLLDMWYIERYKSIQSKLKYDQQRYSRQRLELEARLAIIDHKDEVISLVKSSNDKEEAIHKLKNRFKELSLNQCSILVSTPLHTLTKGTSKLIIEDIDKIKIKLEEIFKNFNSIDDFIYNDAIYIKKKYGKEPILKTDDFKGYVKIQPNGIIQYRTNDEMFNILRTNKSKQMTIHPYEQHKTKYLVTNNKIVQNHLSLPQHIKGDKIITTPLKDTYTLVFYNDGISCIHKVVTSDQDDIQILYVPKHFYGVHRNGKIEAMNTSMISKRTTISSGAKTSLIYAIPGSYKNMIVISMNDTSPNTVYLNRILTSDTDLGKITLVASSKNYILSVVPYGTEEVIINLPEDCVNKIISKYMKFNNLTESLNNKNMMTIPISNRTKKHNLCENMICV